MHYALKIQGSWRCRSAFSYQAPFLWNNLPADIRQSGSTDAFKSKLKTHFFDLGLPSACGSGTTWRYLLSRLLDPHTLHILSFESDILSMQLVNGDFVVLFCTCNIYGMSVNPAGGILPLWLFLRFLPPSLLFFFPVKSFFSPHQHGKLFLTRIKGPRAEDVIHCTDCKAHWGDVIVVFG